MDAKITHPIAAAALCISKVLDVVYVPFRMSIAWNGRRSLCATLIDLSFRECN